MSGEPDNVHLLLAHAGDRRPVLPDGVPLTAALAPPTVDTWPQPPPDDASGDEPDDVLPPIWGVIAPEGSEGDRLLALVAPLIAAREAAQGRKAPVYRVPKARGPMTLGEALAWRRDVFDGCWNLGLDRATFQLVLGDLDQVPFAIQEVQSIDGFVGRLCFPDEAGYGAYVDKVLRAARAPRRGPGRVVMHAAHDGSAALDIGVAGLFQPGEAMLRAELEGGRLAASSLLAHAAPMQPGKALLLDRASAADPGVLFTLSHGLGAPPEGWRSADEQRASQGAMQLGSEAQLNGDDLATGRFMPDGLWLMFACFGAGTPAESVYAHWLAQLRRGRQPTDLTRTLAMGAPFIARLPQKVLANPDGPLAFVGHVDLAWTHSFRDSEDPDQVRAGRFMRVLASALAGDPVGIAFQQLARSVLEADRELIAAYAQQAAAGAGAALDADAVQRAVLWMRRQDLAGFILLGDPAATLPVGGPDASTMDAGAGPAIDRLEQAIGHVLVGARPLAEIAAEAGIPAARLEEHAAAYREAGRRALAKPA